MEQYISEQIHPGIITIQGLLRKIDRLRLPMASRRDVESILVRQVSKEIDHALPWQTGHGCGLVVDRTSDRPDPRRVARSETRRLPPRYRALNASSRPDYRGEHARFRILCHRAESSSAWRLASRTVLLSTRGFHPHSPPPRTMGRIGLSLWHQGTIHPPWSQDSLDCRRLRRRKNPRSFEPCRAKPDRTQNYPSRSRHPI